LFSPYPFDKLRAGKGRQRWVIYQPFSPYQGEINPAGRSLMAKAGGVNINS